MPVIQTNATTDFKPRGRWKVTVPEAFPGFQQYDLVIREIDQAIVFDIQGVEIDVKEMKFIEKDGKRQANVYINGELTKIVIWEEKGDIRGMSETSSGDWFWIFKKV